MSSWRNWLKTLLRKPPEEQPEPLPTPQTPPPPSDNSVPVMPLREWVIRHISPFAWDRAIIRLLSTHHNLTLSLSELLKPQPSTQVPAHLYTALSHIIHEMYGIQVPQNPPTAEYD